MQSKAQSFFEACLNTLSGFLVSFLVQQFIVPTVLGITIAASTNLLITGIFTVTSVLRSYFWRRYFAKRTG